MTRSCSRNRMCQAIMALAVMGLSLASRPAPVKADALSYASSARQIKACVLVSNAATYTVNGVTIPENAEPYVFYMLDRRTDLHPAGWSFVNPLASSTVTPTIRQRWIARDTTAIDTSLANPVFALGAPLTKNIGAYWEVNLDTVSQKDLQNFDIVLLAYHTRATGFSPNERDMLRKYVDAGGTVWLEDEGGFDIQTGGNHTQDQFIVDTAFNGPVVSAANLPSLATFHHPLVNFPFPISSVTVQALGAGSLGVHNIAVDPIAGAVNPRVVVPVIWSGPGGNNLPLVYAGDYGAGHIVISSTGIATDINSYAGGTSVANENGNSGAVSGENTLGVQLTDAEFAINMVAWSSTVSTGAFNPRRTGSSMENIGFGLSTRWATVAGNVAPQVTDSGSAIYKNCVFYVDGYNTLHAYDLLPGESLNDNNNPDDGLLDYINGTPYDQIWLQDLTQLGAGTGFTKNTHFGTPTIYSVNNNGTIVDEIAVQGSNGVTAVFNAFTMNNGLLASSPALLYTVIGAGGSGAGDFGPALVNQHGGEPLMGASPAYSDGILFSMIYDSQSGAFMDPNDAWRVFPTDPITGQNAFGNGEQKNGVAPTPQQLGPVPLFGTAMPIGSPQVGYVTDYTTGAQDKIVYVSTLPDENQTNSGNGGVVNAELFCVKNDPLQDVYNSQYALSGPIPTIQYTTYRAELNRGDIPWFLPPLPWTGPRTMLPVVHRTTGGVTIDLVYDPSGLQPNSFKVEFPIDPTSTGANQVHQIWVIPNTPMLPGDTLSADYTVDWPAVAIPDQTGTPVAPISQNFSYPFTSTFIHNPLGASPGVGPLFFTGATTLSQDDMVFANVGDAPFADRLYAMNVHFQDTNSTVQGAVQPEGMAVRWMFYPNGPIPDEDLPTGSQGVPARLVNTDTFNNLLFGVLPTNPLIATDLESVGAPAYQNGVIYQIGWCHMQFGSGTSAWNAALIMAYQANPTMTFVVHDDNGNPVQLPGVGINSQPSNTNGTGSSSQLQITQVDLIHMVPGQIPPPLITLKQNVNFLQDPVTGAITIYDCRQAGNGESFNVCEPFSVQQSSGLNGPVPLGAPLQLNVAGHSVLDNLLWWMIVPMQMAPGPGLTQDLTAPQIYGLTDTQPAGGPSVIGNTLYYGTEHGNIICVDVTNMPQNGSQATLYKSDGTLRAQMTPALFSSSANATVNQPVVSPPVGTTDVVVSSTPYGITALDNGLTLITDEDRLLEVDYLVNAALSIDSTQTQTVVGGPLASTGNVSSTKIPLARPNTAIHDTIGTFVVADSGNNRVMETNSGGIVTWEIHSFNNGLQFIRPGDPLTLNHPTDVQMYTLAGTGLISFTSPITNNTYSYTGTYYSVHYLVADSGNFRAVEIVDIYDGNGVPVVMSSPGQPAVTMLRQLIFVTQTLSEQNKNLRYRTVQQFVDPSNNLYQASIVDNDAVGGVDPLNPAQSTNPPPADAPGGTVLIVQRTGGVGDGALVSKITGIYDPNPPPGHLAHNKISGPTFFKEYTAVNGQVHYLLCDANGCYDLQPPTKLNPAPNAANGEAVVTWALYATDYEIMTGRPLKAASLQRLGKADYDVATNLFYPHYLITNKYTGDDNVVSLFGNGTNAPLIVNVSNGQIRGEVVEVRGDVYYYGLANSAPYPQGYRTAGQNGAALYYNLNIGNNQGLLTPQNPATTAIVWMAPKETFFQVLPTGTPPAIKRTIGSLTTTGTSSYILEQPTYSNRPY